MDCYTTTAATAASRIHIPTISSPRYSRFCFVIVVADDSTRVDAVRVSGVEVGSASEDMSSLPTRCHATVGQDREGLPITVQFQRSAKFRARKASR
jgi:hypothetical protein